MDELFFIVNGRLLPPGSLVFPANHGGVLYGDGIFETMLMHDGQILNFEAHRNRLINACRMLGYQLPDTLIDKLPGYCRKMTEGWQSESFFRIRLTLMRKDNLFTGKSNEADFMIQGAAIGPPSYLAEGVHTCIFSDSHKATGKLSNIKSCNYQLFLEAYRFARDQGADDAIVINSLQRICESTRANIFLIKNGVITTPPLDEGCVAGTIRKLLLENAGRIHLPVMESNCTQEALMDADEVFLTNAIRWVTPIRSIHNKTLTIRHSRRIFDTIAQLIG